MTLFTGNYGVLAKQWEAGEVMIKMYSMPPALLAMAIITGLALLTFMRIIQFMA